MSKRVGLIISLVIILFSFIFCLFSCFSKEEIPDGDYIAIDYAIVFEVPDYYKEGLEIDTLHEGDSLYLPEGYDDLYCEPANDNGEILDYAPIMCLVEIEHRGERVRGWVLREDIKRNRNK